MSRGRYRFTQVSSAAEFERLAGVWDDLLSRDRNKSPFLTFDWQWSWWQSYANSATDSLAILVVTDVETGQVAGIAPLMLRRRMGLKLLQFIGTGRSDYLGLIVGDGGDDVLVALTEHIIHERGLWDVCFFSNIQDLEFLRLLSTASRGAALLSQRIYEYAPYLAIDTDFDSFIKSKHKNFRKNIRRYSLSDMESGADYSLRKLEINTANVDETVALFSRIEKMSWKYAAGTAHLDQESDRQFWVKLLPRFERQAWLSAWLLSHDGRAVAFIIGLIYSNKMYTHTSAYAEEADGAGNIVRNNLIKTSFDQKLTEFDFLCGDEAYKLSWTDARREVWQAVVCRYRLLPLWYYLGIKMRWRLSKNRRLMVIRQKIKRLLHTASPRRLN